MYTNQTQFESNPTEVIHNQKRQFKQKVQTAVAAVVLVVMLSTLTPSEASAWGPSTPSIPGIRCPECTIYNHNETMILDVD